VPSWDYRHVLAALFISFVAQSLFLPCLCQIGEAKMNFALILDGLVLLRIGIARLLREIGRGWVFYAALLYLSPLWIHLAFLAVLGGH
jgi:hypothetical protein